MPTACTTLWAQWCPNCGACTCTAETFLRITSSGCALHDATSNHIGPVLKREARHVVMGPYETERDTLREPMPREVRAAQTADAEQHDVTGLRLIGAGADIVLRHLADACDAAGVEIADYDRRILAWLSRWEPSTAQVIIGLVTRAHEAGKQGTP